MQIERRERPYLTDEVKRHLAEVYLPRYETKQGALLPTLHAVQHEVGYLPLQALEEIAAFLELAPAQVIDTATFYEEFWLEPKGDYLIGVCRSIACEVCGHRDVLEAVQRKLGIGPGETTADGKFTLVELECLGSCATAPVALVNEELHERLTPQSLLKLLDELPEMDRPVPQVDEPEPAAVGLTQEDQDLESGGQEPQPDGEPGEEPQP